MLKRTILLLTLVIIIVSCEQLDQIITNNRYNVTYDGNGSTSGEVPNDQNSYVAGSTVIVLNNSGSLKKENYKFKNWNTKNDGSGEPYSAGSEITIETSHVILFAQWISLPEYTISFNTNEGSSVTNQTIKEGNVIIEPIDPVKTNYIFEGWYTESEFINLWDFNNHITNDITLYANWSKKKLQVTFFIESSYNNEIQIVDYGNKIIEPNNPIKENYTFDGWYTEPELMNLWDFNNELLDNKTLYPKWIKENLEVTFFSDTNHQEKQIVKNGNSIIKPKDPYKYVFVFDSWAADFNYIFHGWYTEPECINLWDFNNKISQDVTLYAMWSIEKLKISFVTNIFDPLYELQIVDYGNKIIKPSDPFKKDYIFGGWYTDVSCTNIWDFEVIPQEPMLLYAKWVYDRESAGRY